MTVLEQVGKWLVAARDQPLPPAARQRLAIHLLDTLGAWIAGRATEEGVMLARLKSQPRPSFPLFSDNPLDRIALACATIRLTEIDDIHMTSCTTPSSVVVSTALVLAVGEEPRLFTEALCAGYEVMTRVGTAIDGPNVVYQGIWPTYCAAPMGAAAVAARLLKLDPGKTADALGMALAMTSGAPGGPSSPSPRWLLLGLAVRAGCSAALAAAEGYTIDRKLLDDDWLTRTHGIRCDPTSLLAEPQNGAAITSLSLKPYCAAKQCMAAIEAFRQLLGQGISASEISSLRVAVPPAYSAMIGHRHANSGRIPRITSAAYNIALAACEPEGLADIARPDRTHDSQIAALMERVEVVADEALSRYYPAHWPARAEARLRNGHTASSLVLDAPGDPSRAFEIDQVQEKFHRYADSLIGKTCADELSAACLAATENDDALATLCAWSKDI